MNERKKEKKKLRGLVVFVIKKKKIRGLFVLVINEKKKEKKF